MQELLDRRMKLEIRQKTTTDLKEWEDVSDEINVLNMKIQSRLDRENSKKFSGIETLTVPKQ
jgi:hypothetical protein